MKSIVCDASPLIFLAKLDRLSVIPAVLEGDVFVLQCVVEEVLAEHAGPVERCRLEAFFSHERVQTIEFDDDQLQPASVTLSRSDQLTLAWAKENRADWLVADERLLRKIAINQGISVIGFLGILIQSAKRGILLPVEVRDAIREAVSRHQCRISVALYQRLIDELDRMEGKV